MTDLTSAETAQAIDVAYWSLTADERAQIDNMTKTLIAEMQRRSIMVKVSVTQIHELLARVGIWMNAHGTA